VRGHAAAHRLAADEQACSGTPLARHRDGVVEGALEHGRAVRHVPPLLHVGEVEREDVDSAAGEAARGRHHEWMPLSGAGAVRQHEQRLPRPLRRVTSHSARPGCVLGHYSWGELCSWTGVEPLRTLRLIISTKIENPIAK
jgi:hypothetical protein